MKYLLTLVFLLVGHSGYMLAANVNEPINNAIILSERDIGKEVEVKLGDFLEFGGYEGGIAGGGGLGPLYRFDEKFLKFIREDTNRLPFRGPDSISVTRTWYYKTVNAGNTTIDFGYGQINLKIVKEAEDENSVPIVVLEPKDVGKEVEVRVGSVVRIQETFGKWYPSHLYDYDKRLLKLTKEYAVSNLKGTHDAYVKNIREFETIKEGEATIKIGRYGEHEFKIRIVKDPGEKK